MSNLTIILTTANIILIIFIITINIKTIRTKSNNIKKINSIIKTQNDFVKKTTMEALIRANIVLKTKKEKKFCKTHLIYLEKRVVDLAENNKINSKMGNTGLKSIISDFKKDIIDLKKHIKNSEEKQYVIKYILKLITMSEKLIQ